jgi:hypothetical protein
VIPGRKKRSSFHFTLQRICATLTHGVISCTASVDKTSINQLLGFSLLFNRTFNFAPLDVYRPPNHVDYRCVGSFVLHIKPDAALFCFPAQSIISPRRDWEAQHGVRAAKKVMPMNVLLFWTAAPCSIRCYSQQLVFPPSAQHADLLVAGTRGMNAVVTNLWPWIECSPST